MGTFSAKGTLVSPKYVKNHITYTRKSNSVRIKDPKTGKSKTIAMCRKKAGYSFNKKSNQKIRSKKH